jgi:hypothetical protein
MSTDQKKASRPNDSYRSSAPDGVGGSLMAGASAVKIDRLEIYIRPASAPHPPRVKLTALIKSALWYGPSLSPIRVRQIELNQSRTNRNPVSRIFLMINFA